MNRRLRKVWLMAHRWLGLTAGLLFVLIGLSGSLLVFHRAIDEWLNPELLLTTHSGSQRTLADVVAAAENAFSDPPARAQFVDSPRTDRGVWIVWLRSEAQTASGFTQVYVDPHTAEVTGRRVWGEYLTTWVYRLHHRLLAGKTGETIVGLSGLVLMASVGTGMFLWWPLWKHSWRAAWAVRGGRRLNYDLHKTTGIVSAALLLVLAFTGVYLVFPGWIKPCVTAVSAETVPRSDDLHSTPRSGRARIGPDQAAAVAQEVFPDAELKRLYLPTGPEDVYVARVRRPGEVRRSSGNSRIWIDQYRGAVLAVRDWNQRTAADVFFAWQFPLHNGETFGLVGRWIVFVAGLAPGVLYATGILLWWRKLRSRRRQLLRTHAPDDAGVIRGIHRTFGAQTPAQQPEQCSD